MSEPVAATAETRARSAEISGRVGMVIFLGAAAMLFAALLFAYGVMRAQAVSWPPPGVAHLPRLALGANTALLALASVALHRRRPGLGLGLGAAFLAAQAALWQAAVGAGAGPASGAYASVFFALSGFHALHVLGGVLALGAVVARGRRPAPLRLVRLYWDFVLGVWLLFYVVVFLP